MLAYLLCNKMCNQTQYPFSTLKDDQLVGEQHDDHDWEKISNIDVSYIVVLLTCSQRHLVLSSNISHFKSMKGLVSVWQFEGLRQADDLKRFWQNYLHPSINKSVWKQDEIDKLKGIVEEFNCCHWDKIAEALGVRIEKFMHFQNSCLC